MKKLAENQVKAFDIEFVDENRWKRIKALIDLDFRNRPFHLLDVGGGNGLFADRILATYPNAQVTVLDTSEALLGKNALHPRKICLLESAENLNQLSMKYDLISFNWLLHHLVGNSLLQTRQNQIETLKIARNLLSPDGRISVFENGYEGWIFKHLPGQLIYFLTSLKSIAPLTKKLGANTAGVGVCFLSKEEWFKTMNQAGLTVINYSEPDEWTWSIQWYWRILLHVKYRVIGLFWLQKE